MMLYITSQMALFKSALKIKFTVNRIYCEIDLYYCNHTQKYQLLSEPLSPNSISDYACAITTP